MYHTIITYGRICSIKYYLISMHTRMYLQPNPHRCDVILLWTIRAGCLPIHSGCLQPSVTHRGSVVVVELYFSWWCWRSCQNSWNCEHRKPPCINHAMHTIWKVSDWQCLHFSAWRWSHTQYQHSKRIPGLKKRHSGTQSVISWPDHEQEAADIHRRALNVLRIARRIEDNSKKLQEISVQPVSKIFKLLEMYKLFLFSLCAVFTCIFPHVSVNHCTYFKF